AAMDRAAGRSAQRHKGGGPAQRARGTAAEQSALVPGPGPPGGVKKTGRQSQPFGAQPCEPVTAGPFARMAASSCRSTLPSTPMIYATLKLLHVLAVVFWVGGMAFAHTCLRPSVQLLQPPERLRLMHAVMGRFFSGVLVAALLVLASGLWMIGRVAKESVQAGVNFAMPLDWILMAVLGIVMIAIFGHIRFALFKRLSRAVAASDWAAGGQALAQI